MRQIQDRRRRSGRQAGADRRPAPGTPHTNKVIHTLKSAGLAPEGFATTEPARYGASFCEYGRVNDIDALVCEFADGGSLARGKQLLGDEWGRERACRPA